MDITQYTKNIPAELLAFVREVREHAPVALKSIHVVGSVLTPDYQEDLSDANSLFVIQEPQTVFLDFLVGLGKRFGRQNVAPPLLMTENYIQRSLDVFPIEFYGFREIHYTLYGNDILAGLEINPGFLRLQCEREIKAKLLWLGRIYLETLADNARLSHALCNSITAYVPLFRAILFLIGREVPPAAAEVIAAVESMLNIDTAVFQKLYVMKRDQVTLGSDELKVLYTTLYTATQQVCDYVDAMDN
ncbi:MAG TPA: hypothetical protein ENK84_12890 [Desulfobulbus sp.]|nr:hypothetical protein [Desulfobulbus sp.]